LYYSVSGGVSWQNLAYIITGDDGNLTCVWNPSSSGNYVIEAVWSGSSEYSSVNATYNFAVEPFNNQNQNVFSVTSNSNLTSLTFNSTQNQLSFVVSGPSGTSGLTEVCIPQSLIPDISTLAVTLDGDTINYTANSSNNVWIITLTYQNNSHAIVMDLDSSPTPTTTSEPTENPTPSPESTPTPTATPVFTPFVTTAASSEPAGSTPLEAPELGFQMILVLLALVTFAVLAINRRNKM
jgi:hypothetical protein